MARPFFQMAGLLAVRQTRQKFKGRDALSRSGNIVIGAFDGFHGNVGDLAKVNPGSRNDETVLRDLALLEDAVHGGQIEFRSHVHNGQIFVIKAVMGIMIRRFAARDPHDLVQEGLSVAFRIHRDEALQLQQARIDHPPGTLVLEADALDGGFLKLAHRNPATEIGHLGGGGIGVDRPADQGQ